MDFSLKNEAMALGIANGAISAFELINGTPGLVSLISGGSTLGYSIYKYTQDSKKVAQNRNWGDAIGDIINTGVHTATGVAEGVGWLGNNLYLVAVLAGGGILVYFLSGSIKGPTLDLSGSAFPAVAGGIMGLSGAGILYADKVATTAATNPITDTTHKIAVQVDKGVAPSISNMTAATTQTGWQKFGYNFTHPGDYFPAYGKRVSTEWKNVHDVGSFFSAWTTTFMVIGDMFTTDKKSQDDQPPPPPAQRYYGTEDFESWLKENPNASQQMQTAAFHHYVLHEG